MSTRNLLAASLATLALGIASAAQPRFESPPPGSSAAPEGFGFRCDGEEFVFAGACTGGYQGVIGLALFDFREARWDRADDLVLERFGIRNVTDPRANYAPRADWSGPACQTTSDRLLELKGVLPDFIYEIPMNKCQGFGAADGNFAVTELEIFITDEGPRIGSIEGVFRGHRDNTVIEGSFRDALVARYGPKNCESGLALSYCRQGQRSKITVQEMQPAADGSRFYVRIRTPATRNSAIERVNRAIEEARKKAPVNDF